MTINLVQVGFGQRRQPAEQECKPRIATGYLLEFWGDFPGQSQEFLGLNVKHVRKAANCGFSWGLSVIVLQLRQVGEVNSDPSGDLTLTETRGSPEVTDSAAEGGYRIEQLVN